MSFTLFPIVDVALPWEAEGGLLLNRHGQGGNVGAVDNSSNNSYGSINRCKDWQGASKGIEADSWGAVGIANAEAHH